MKELQLKYPGYRLYFPSPPELPDPDGKIQAAIEFLRRRRCQNRQLIMNIEELEYFDEIYNNIIEDETFMKSWPGFSHDFEEKPEHVFKYFGLAMHTIIFEAATETDNVDEEHSNMDVSRNIQEINLPYIRFGIMKGEPITSLRSIKASLLGKFVTIRGAVIRMGVHKFQCTRLTFRCGECSKEFWIEQPEGRYKPPKKCGASKSCKNTSKSSFDPVPNAPTTKVVEYRRIRIQDVEHSRFEHGRVPKTIDCDLYYDMASRCGAADSLTLCGIVKLSEESVSGKGMDKSLHSIHVEVFAMRNNNDSDRTIGGGWCTYSDSDHQIIRGVFEKSDDILPYLVTSLCPSIYGHELVKAGILLALFGGTPNDDHFGCRPDINVLMVGDPGLGKSQMLKIVNQVAPRGVYVCGSGSTTAGLTVTLVKEGSSYSLDAGALVMADKGTCCIDEFDKMQHQHSALLEAMEQQSVSLAKAGVFRTLPARTSVIAAANPVAGHYDDDRSVSDNIRISGPLLSRFDLIFLMKDRPNTKYDQSLVKHIMNFPSKNSTVPVNTVGNTSANNPANNHQSLLEKLQGCQHKPLEHDKLRKYIAYAKQYVKPKMSPEAAAQIKDYYLNLRQAHRNVDSTPVTTRQLESLVRLAEARAKLELRETVTETDAKDVISIFEFSMTGVFENDVMVHSGLAQTSFVGVSPQVKSGASRSGTKNKAKRFISQLQVVAQCQSKNIFSLDELKSVAGAIGLPQDSEFDNMLDRLNNEGFLLKKPNRVYQIQC